MRSKVNVDGPLSSACLSVGMAQDRCLQPSGLAHPGIVVSLSLNY